MAVKPIVNKIDTFDPSLGYTFSFTYSGNQSRSNRLIITDNDTNTIVYDNTVVTMRLEQSLPIPNVLKTNKQYSAQFQSIDSAGEASPLSDKLYFYCLKTPTFKFTNLVEKIENSSYEFIVEYQQDEGELLKDYEFILWSNGGAAEIDTSGVLFAPIGSDTLSYKFSAFDNNQIYYIQAVGTTVHGMTVDTGEVQISVSYLKPNQYSTFYAENDEANGIIRYFTNNVVIPYNGTETFEFDNGKIILLSKKIYYDSGFNITGDFCIKIKGSNFGVNGDHLFMATNGTDTLTLRCVDDENETLRFILTVSNHVSSYVLISSAVAGDVNNDMFTVVINRKSNLYGIRAYVESGGAINGDLYIGSTYPDSPDTYAIYIQDSSHPTVMVAKENVSITCSKIVPDSPNDMDIWFSEV